MCNCSTSPGTHEQEVRPAIHALPWRLRKAVRQGRLTMQEALAVRARGLSIAQAVRRGRRTRRQAAVREPWRASAELEEMEGETSGTRPGRMSLRTAPPMRASSAAPAGKPLSTRYACYPESASYCIGWTATEGPFGLALARFTDAACDSTFVTSVLTQSPTFMAMVKELDKRYIGLGTRLLCRTNRAGVSEQIPWQVEFKPDLNGVLTQAPFKGRRVIEFVGSEDGSEFAAAGSLDRNLEWDTIGIRNHAPGKSAHEAGQKAQRVSSIAHETAHAFRFVTGANGPRRATLAARVRQSIVDELETRKIEVKVIAEAARAKGGEFLKELASRDAPDIDAVERSFVSGKFMMTYLEKAVLEELMIDAIRQLGPTATKQQIGAIDRAVDSVPILRHGFYDQDHKSILLPPQGAAAKGPRATAYGRYRLLRRAIDERWRRFTRTDVAQPTPVSLEEIRKVHAKFFFPSDIRYAADVAEERFRQGKRLRKAGLELESDIRRPKLGARPLPIRRRPRQAAPVHVASSGPAVVEEKPQYLSKRYPCIRDWTPECTPPMLGTGGYSFAISRMTDQFCLDDRFFDALKSSATFMAMVKLLDLSYVAEDWPPLCRTLPDGTRREIDPWAEWGIDDKGFIKKGPFAKRRMLSALIDLSGGSSFMPAGSIDGNEAIDRMTIGHPGNMPPLPAHTWHAILLTRIAHEAGHAFRFLKGLASGGGSLEARVGKAIDDEVATRRMEASVLSEASKSRAGGFLRDHLHLAGDVARPLVERSFVSGEQRLTYLEKFTLEISMVDAIARDKLGKDAVTAIDEAIDAIPLERRNLDEDVRAAIVTWVDPRTGESSAIVSAYGRFRFLRRVVNARWRRLLEPVKGRAPATAADIEKLRQVHARAFFPAGVAYGIVKP